VLDVPRAVNAGRCFLGTAGVLAAFTVAPGEGAPDPRGQHSQPVADGRGDAPDHALDDAAAREQRRREGKAPGGERAPAAGERDIKQLPGFPGRWRRLRAISGCHGQRDFGGRGRLAGSERIGRTLAGRIWMLTG
jgi:hypothetical protein